MPSGQDGRPRTWKTRSPTRYRALRWLYGGRLRFALNHKTFTLSFPFTVFVLGMGAWFGLPSVLRPVERVANIFGADLNDLPGYVKAKHVFTGLKSDDWIALDEGSWPYMPSLYPAASFNQAMEVLQSQDARIKQIPEVANVLGKMGRAQSALDPAPGAMIETYVMLKPRDQWRPGISERKIWDEINAVATLPGVTRRSFPKATRSTSLSSRSARNVVFVTLHCPSFSPTPCIAQGIT